MTEKWTAEDSAKARVEGWDLYEVWDGRIEWVVQKFDGSSLQSSDEGARLYVAHRAKNNDALCRKALLIAFQSKMPDFDEVARKTKQRRRQA